MKVKVENILQPRNYFCWLRYVPNEVNYDILKRLDRTIDFKFSCARNARLRGNRHAYT